MLIVVVIIGILAAALLPRMMGAQDAARDTSRMTALRDIGIAMSSFQAQKGFWPQQSTKSNGHTIDLAMELVTGGYLKEIPMDPVRNNSFTGFVNGSGNSYQYQIITRNGVASWAVVLAAKAQTDGTANWLYTGTLGMGIIATTEASTLKPCATMTAGSGTPVLNQWGNCTYTDKSQLRYILVQ